VYITQDKLKIVRVIKYLMPMENLEFSILVLKLEHGGMTRCMKKF